jgi:hypothetical protein
MNIYRNNPPECANPDCSNLVEWDKWNNKYKKACSRSCAGKLSYINGKEQREKTCLKKYGSISPLGNKGVQNKIKDTNLQKYGVEYPQQSDEIKEATIASNLEKYGYKHTGQVPELNAKRKETWKTKYGVDNPNISEKIKEKKKKTCLKKYGVENHMQNKELYEKIKHKMYKFKEYILPSGNKIDVQGYECQALDILLEKFSEKDIVYKDNETPDIWYEINGQTKRYYPDFYIPKENLIIEVKSKYTFQADLEKNLAKEKACKKAGFNFEFMIL